MAEETTDPPQDASEASTPIPPIDNIHSIPDLPPPEPMLPPTHALPQPQPNLDIEMSEEAAAVRSPSHPLSHSPSRSNHSLTDESDLQASTPPIELRSYTTHAHPDRTAHRDTHPARQWYGRSRGRAADAVESGKPWGAGEAVFE